MSACPATTGQHRRTTDYRNHGCRCDAARADRERDRKQGHLLPPKMVPAVGSRRRLRALMAIGHSQDEINVHLGRKPSGSLGPLLWDENRKNVRREMHERICAIYDQLWRTPGTGPRAELVRARARARNWPPPLFWDDDLIDDPLYDGEKEFTNDFINQIKNTPSLADRRVRTAETVVDLTEKGLSAKEIAERLGCSDRQVVRLRGLLRSTEAADVTDPERTLGDMQVAS